MSKRDTIRSAEELAQLLSHERDGIGQRDFEKLAVLNVRKAALVGLLESALTRTVFGDDNQSMLAALADIQSKAAANASQLEQIKCGILDARRRIDALLEADKRSGLYAANGGELPPPKKSAFGKSV